MTKKKQHDDIEEAISMFTGLFTDSLTPDNDVNYKILFLAVLRREEICRWVFQEQPAFAETVRLICVDMLKGERRQDLKAVCRRVLAVFWPVPVDVIAKARATAMAQLSARAAARAKELLG